MAEYRSCPTCGNLEKGISIHQCTNCGYIGCFKGGGLLSSNTGCYSGGRCPSCDKLHSSRQLGRVY